MMKKNTITTFLFLFGLVALPVLVFADQLHIDTDVREYAMHDQFLATVHLDAGEQFNALDGVFQYAPTVLRIVAIHDGNSLVSFWLEAPHETTAGTILFSGMTPGGFQGANEKVFDVLFEVTSKGDPSLRISNAHLYKNDGTGTSIAISEQSPAVSITAASKEAKTVELYDVEPPEDFTPSVAHDDALFGGANFLVFGTQDKGLGVDRYEVREGMLGMYREAKSPYLLRRQLLDRPIYIHAVDREGNVREVVVPPRVSIPLWRQGEWIALLIICVLLANGFWYFFHHRRLFTHVRSLFHSRVK